MATIINTPPAEGSSDSGIGVVLGVLLGIILIILFFVYGLPMLRENQAPKDDKIEVQVNLPSGGVTPTPTP